MVQVFDSYFVPQVDEQLYNFRYTSQKTAYLIS